MRGFKRREGCTSIIFQGVASSVAGHDLQHKYGPLPRAAADVLGCYPVSCCMTIQTITVLHACACH